VQILGDSSGTVAHLFERECSIQRRYQKIIEEAPSPVVDGELRERLCSAAVAAGEAIGYVGAGTVEFVLDAQLRFFFLEVNTRLQVEHPVTEAITGLDLVRLQLEIAGGAPLPPDVLGAGISGHAIEARLYAEDVRGGYLPASGDVHDLQIGEGLRVDAEFTAGTRVSTFYDSMLAKVISHAGTRDEARRALAAGLDRARVHGVSTNRDLLVAVLRNSEFAAGRIDTGLLDRHPPEELVPERVVPPEHLLAVALAAQAQHRAIAPVLTTLPVGWRNNSSELQHVELAVGETVHRVGYAIDRHGLRAEVDGRALSVPQLFSVTNGVVDLAVAGIRRRISVATYDGTTYVDSVLGHDVLTEVERFPDPAATVTAGSLLAPMPGTVVRVAVSVGDTVAAGATVLAIEAMKMDHTIAAPADGYVDEVHVEVGSQVDTGQVLAVLSDVAVEGGPDE